MAYLKWFLSFLPSCFMAVFGRLIAPILPMFASDDGWLPSWLSWFQTPFDSLDGDYDHQQKWPGTDVWSTYKRRTAWLLRNVAYGFDMRVCGVEVDPDVDQIEVIGDPNISDQSGISGLVRWRAYREGRLITWQWYFVWHYEIFKSFRCVRIGAGWKIWDDEKLREQPAQYWTVINLFKTAFD